MYIRTCAGHDLIPLILNILDNVKLLKEIFLFDFRMVITNDVLTITNASPEQSQVSNKNVDKLNLINNGFFNFTFKYL